MKDVANHFRILICSSLELLFIITSIFKMNTSAFNDQQTNGLSHACAENERKGFPAGSNGNHVMDRFVGMDKNTISSNNDNKETQTMVHTATAVICTATSTSGSATNLSSTETTRSCTESSVPSTTLSLAQNANYEENCDTIRSVVIGKLDPIKDKVRIKTLKNKKISVKFPVKVSMKSFE